MRRIYRQFRLVRVYGLIACMLILIVATVALAQGTTQDFRYVIPKFTSINGSELIVSNLSSQVVTPETLFVDSATQRTIDTSINILPGSQLRLTAASFGLASFNGSVVLNSSFPLSVQATLADGLGGFETVQSAVNSDNLIVPFAAETAGSTDLTLFNPQSSATVVLISVVASDGTTVGSAQRILPAFGTINQIAAALIPPVASGVRPDISHVIIRTLSNILGAARSVYAQASLINFSADAEGSIGPHFDPAVITAVPVSSGVLKTTVPFFVQGGDYITIVQVTNPSGDTGSVTMTAIGLDGNVIKGANPVVVQIPANGSFRRGLQKVFNFAPGVQLGSIIVESSIPTITTTGLLSVSQNGFALMPAAEPANTNFVYRIRAADPQFYMGLAFRNPNASAANLTVLNFPDDGSGASSESLTIAPFALGVRTLLDLLPEARSPGFIYVSSNVPIFAQGIEGRGDNGVLANLPAMHSQPDYVAPAPNKFLITGAVRHNNALLSGASVQLSGSRTASVVTDESGNYQFPNILAGQYTVTVAKTGYTFEPLSIAVAVSGSSRRGIDFAGTLITPTVTAVLPAGVLAGSPATDIIVAGSPIITTSEILFEGSPVVTSVTSAGVPVTLVGATGGLSVVIQQQTVLKATLGPALLATPRTATVAIRNNGPGGSATSATKPFGVGGPAPALTSLSDVPNPLIAGNSGFTMTVTGTGFTPGTVVAFNGTPVATTFVNETQLVATVPASLLADPGVQRITAVKPPPTIGPSNELTVVIASPAPEVTSISPNSAEARLTETAPPMAITVRGFNYVRQSIVLIDGVSVPTEYRSATELVGSIPQPQLELARSAIISVKNPDPVQPEFHFNPQVPLVLYNPVPTVTSVDASVLLYDPTPRFIGDDPKYAARIAIRGTNFSKSLIRYLTSTPCIDRTGTFSGDRISSTLIVGNISIACTGAYQFGATNLQPGGGVSPTLIGFNVTTYTAATPLSVTGLSPAGITAGASTFTLTISGTNFAAGAYVNFGAAVLIPTAVTANSITVTVPSFLVRNAGIIPVSVTNLGTTGNSNRILFTVN